jgi:hypothetical protein
MWFAVGVVAVITVLVAIAIQRRRRLVSRGPATSSLAQPLDEGEDPPRPTGDGPDPS